MSHPIHRRARHVTSYDAAMLLIAVLFALVTVGLVGPCLIDVAITPQQEVRRFSKRAWVLALVFFNIFGAFAWLALGRPHGYWRTQQARRLAGTPGMGAAEALRRHPAGRAMGLDVEDFADPGARSAAELRIRPLGPDDDPAFLQELDRRIHGGPDFGIGG
jgi:Phospholipase_D-nuclease N-terminal